MPFGLCNSLATFQRIMEVTLRGLARNKCVVHLDDILVMGKSFQEHLNNLKAVFGRSCVAILRLKPQKCHLVKHEVKYLGYGCHIVESVQILTKSQLYKTIQDHRLLSSYIPFWGLPRIIGVLYSLLTGHCNTVCTDKEKCFIQVNSHLPRYVQTIKTGTNITYTSASTHFPRFF